MELPVSVRPESVPSRLSVQPEKKEQQPQPAVVRAEFPRLRQRLRKRRQCRGGEMLKSWILFVVLAAVCYVLRYRNILSLNNLQLTIDGALIAFACIHLYVITLAFSDDSFQAVLCLLIPFYSLYYLFFLSDAFYLRALVAALAIAFGWDALVFARDHFLSIYSQISVWLEQKEWQD